jgi:hypothetical protein
MSQHVLLIEQSGDWKPRFPEYPVVCADDYLTQAGVLERIPAAGHQPVSQSSLPERGLLLLAACRGARPQGHSDGAYAAGSVENRSIRWTPRTSIARWRGCWGASGRPAADRIRDDGVLRSVCTEVEMQEIAQQLFSMFRAPLFKVEFKLAVSGASMPSSPSRSMPHARTRRRLLRRPRYLSQAPWRKPSRSRGYKYDLAILQNPDEDLPPSNRTALSRFIRVGRSRWAGGGSHRPQGFLDWRSTTPFSFARPHVSITTPIASPARPTARAWWSWTTRIPSSSAPTRSISPNSWRPTRWPRLVR